MSIKKRYWVIIFVSFFLVLVLAKAPASWAMSLMAKALPGWQVAQVKGSFWQGEAGAAQFMVDGQPLSLGRIKWKMQPLGLLRLKPCVRFSASRTDQVVDGEACVSLLSQTISSDNLKVRLDLKQIEPWLLVRLQGKAQLDLTRFSFADNQFKDLQGQLSWQEAEIHNSQRWIGLGDLQATLDDDQAGGVITQWSAKEGGPIATDLKIQLPSGGGSLIRGKVTPARNADEAIYQSLQVIGEPAGNGAYSIDWQG